MSSAHLPRLYPIVNVHGPDEGERRRAIALADALADAGVTLVQLRAKNVPTGALTELAAVLVTRLAASACRLIVNDRADVAAAVDAWGVHLGDEDLPVDDARRIVGPAKVVGVSTHCLADVEKAAATTADYIGFGPVFESPTKTGARAARGLSLLEQACAVSALPVCAIGGITAATAVAAWRAGARSVAVISDFERTSDVARLVRAYVKHAPDDRGNE